MPTCARKVVVEEGVVGFYHVWGRCVRRAYLCGTDKLTGKNYDYRRDWIVETEKDFAALFAVEICFHVETGNELNLVLRTRPDIVKGLSDEDVVRRVLTINKRTLNLAGETEDPSENEILIVMNDEEMVAEFRKRLSCPSWFMKAVRENVARRANSEDGCTGAFWDGRFGGRRLLDDTAIVICGFFVDLNQVLAGEASTPNDSTRTSAFDRLSSIAFRKTAESKSIPQDEIDQRVPDGWLTELSRHKPESVSANRAIGPSKTARRASDLGTLDVSDEWYFELLNWTCNEIRNSVPSQMPAHLSSVLEGLSIRAERWIDLVTNFHKWFGIFAGSYYRLKQYASTIGRRLFRDAHPLESAFQIVSTR